MLPSCLAWLESNDAHRLHIYSLWLLLLLLFYSAMYIDRRHHRSVFRCVVNGAFRLSLLNVARRRLCFRFVLVITSDLQQQLLS